MSTEQTPDRRRTSRIPHRARIILSAVDADGFSFAEETETVMVGKHGMSARTSYNLALGQEVSVRTKDKNRVGQFKVVFLGTAGTANEGLVGLEWLEARRFWGIEFPPEDWGGD